MAIKYDYTAEEANELDHASRMRLISLCARAKQAAGCAMPQFIPQGAGSRFILEAISDGMDVSDDMDNWGSVKMADDADDYISEVADNVVPVYYDTLWHAWLALKGYEYDNNTFGDELPRGRDDLEKIPQQDLYDMAYKIISDVVDNPKEYGFITPEPSDRWAGDI